MRATDSISTIGFRTAARCQPTSLTSSALPGWRNYRGDSSSDLHSLIPAHLRSADNRGLTSNFRVVFPSPAPKLIDSSQRREDVAALLNVGRDSFSGA
jgi:hypothetical protein